MIAVATISPDTGAGALTAIASTGESAGTHGMHEAFITPAAVTALSTLIFSGSRAATSRTSAAQSTAHGVKAGCQKWPAVALMRPAEA